MTDYFAATSTATATAWQAWTSSGTIATTTISPTSSVSAITIWPYWVEETIYHSSPPPRHEAHVLCRREYLRRIAAQRQKRLARIKELRAKRLLNQCLDQEQRQTLKERDHFYMRTASGKLYRIEYGRAGNVFLMEGDLVARRYCIHPDDYCPNYDTMLMQKLMLETDEEQFLRMANATIVRH